MRQCLFFSSEKLERRHLLAQLPEIGLVIGLLVFGTTGPFTTGLGGSVVVLRMVSTP